MNRLVACSCWQQPPRRACSCSWSKLCHLPQFHRGRHAFPWQGVQQCADACCSPCCFWERSDCSVRGICAAIPPMAWRCLPDGCAPMVTATPKPFCEPRSFRRWCRAVHRWPGVLDHPALASLAHSSRRGSTATCADLLHRWTSQACLQRRAPPARTDWTVGGRPGLPSAPVAARRARSSPLRHYPSRRSAFDSGRSRISGAV